MAEARTEAGLTGAEGDTRTAAVFMEAAGRTTRVEAVDTLAPGVRAAVGIFSGAPEVVADSAAADRRAARRWRGQAGHEALQVADTAQERTAAARMRAVPRAHRAVIHRARTVVEATGGLAVATAVGTPAVGRQTAPMAAVCVLAMGTAGTTEILAATAHRVLVELTVADTVVRDQVEQQILMQTRLIRATDATLEITEGCRIATIQE